MRPTKHKTQDSGMLKMTWRASLTRRFAGLYLAAPGYCEGNPFYRLTLTGEIDNPDQRICQARLRMCLV